MIPHLRVHHDRRDHHHDHHHDRHHDRHRDHHHHHDLHVHHRAEYQLLLLNG